MTTDYQIITSWGKSYLWALGLKKYLLIIAYMISYY